MTGTIFGGWRAVNVRADNEPAYPALQMNITADYVTLVSQTNGDLKTIAEGLSQHCFIHTFGHHGRDQGAPFVAGDNVWCCYIWGAELGVSTIFTKRKPKDGGPILPNGFTHFAPAFVVKMVGGATLFPLHSGGHTLIRIRGNRAFYLNSIFYEFMDAGLADARFVPFGDWLPLPDALSAQIEFDPEMVAGNNQGSGGMAGMIAYPIHPSVEGSGPFINLSVYSPEPNRPAAQIAVADFPIEANGLMTSIWSPISGAVASTQSVFFLQGYTFSNG